MPNEQYTCYLTMLFGELATSLGGNDVLLIDTISETHLVFVLSGK